jgi:hypothetical protein
MHRNHKQFPVYGLILLLATIAIAVILSAGLTQHRAWYNLLYAAVPALLLAWGAFHRERKQGNK